MQNFCIHGSKRKKILDHSLFSRSCSVFVRMNSRTFFPSSNDAGMNFLARSAARAGGFVAIHVLKPKILGKEKNSNIDIDYLWTVDT